LQDVPVPIPGEGEILVRVRAIGLNFADLFGRMGVYPGTPSPPFIPGLEFSGDVVGTGPGEAQFAGGERVMGYSRWGSHAEYVVLRGLHATEIPGSMSYTEGAAFLATGLTAYHGLIRLANLRSGEVLLIHAAAGGVGLAAVQLGKALGARIFATAGSDEKIALALHHGAHHGINYRTSDFASEVRRMAGPEGVDVIMDGVGGEVFAKSWPLLAPMGRYVLFGVSAVTGRGGLSRLRAAGVMARMLPIFPVRFVSANKALFGFNLATLRGKDQYLREAMMELLRWYSIGALKPVIGKIFPFDRIVDAHDYLQSRKSVGKVVVVLEHQG
jgi:NADPH:quinone reductase-like Zn-dependent oxidoreductase